MERPARPLRWLFDSYGGPTNVLLPRWLFLRALAAIYFSAFLALAFQIKGLIGPEGVLPAGHYLSAMARALGPLRFWGAPSLFWISSSSAMLLIVTWVGLLAAVAAFFNLWPRLCFSLCFICFLSFVTAAADFSGYQSDGMLLEAGFLALFFAPPGLRPGLAPEHPPVRAGLFLLRWEWFRIYFESGMVKMLSGDPQWRDLTAMHEYYQNGPLPTWLGWYVGHFPHWFHTATTLGTLILEFGIVLLLFLGRRARLICFLIVTPWELGVIFTANYAFLNYLVLSLGILLLDDTTLKQFVPARLRPPAPVQPEIATEAAQPQEASGLRVHWHSACIAVGAVALTWIAYATTVEMLGLVMPGNPLPKFPVVALEPFRIANQYGLFAVMTRGRYEIEFQGSDDAKNWKPYPFRFKPQDLNARPAIYAPYQPRFDWNLWFASLGDWQQNEIVPVTEERLLKNDADVLALFRGSPFAQAPPHYVRAVLWQYWFTSSEEKRRTGNWWRREYLGLYAPTLTLGERGAIEVVEAPKELPPRE